MNLLETIETKARKSCPHIVLAEGEDKRIATAAIEATNKGIAQISVIAEPESYYALVKNLPNAENIKVHDPKKSHLIDEFADHYYQLRKHRGIDKDEAIQAVKKNVNFAALMVSLGYADGTIAGAVETTADTIKAALQIIGKDPSSSIVSSYFLMLLKNPQNRVVAFADCALIPSPSAPELADIAIATAQSFSAFTDIRPRVAMLSFSTHGSASHESVLKVQQAVEIARSQDPDLIIDGEIQFDTAIIPEIQKVKAPNSSLAGEANVFIFPDLNSGNIGYKIAERLGGATALGPVLQGLNMPANDLSRGCSTEDVLQMIAITAVQVAINRT